MKAKKKLKEKSIIYRFVKTSGYVDICLVSHPDVNSINKQNLLEGRPLVVQASPTR